MADVISLRLPHTNKKRGANSVPGSRCKSGLTSSKPKRKENAFICMCSLTLWPLHESKSQRSKSNTTKVKHFF